MQQARNRFAMDRVSSVSCIGGEEGGNLECTLRRACARWHVENRRVRSRDPRFGCATDTGHVSARVLFDEK